MTDATGWTRAKAYGRHWALVAAAALTTLLHLPPATAQACSTGTGEPLAAAAVEKRLAFIQGVLEAEQRKARIWNWGWGIGLTASAAGQLTVASLANDANVQRRFALGGVRPLAAAAFQVIRPLRIRLPAAAGDRCADLAAAESALRDAAAAERAQLAWFVPRLGAIALNVAAGVALWAWGQEVDAVVGTSVGLVLSEIRFQTAPWGAVRARQRYEAGDFTHRNTAGPRWMLVPSVAGTSAGATLVMRF